MPQPFLTIYTIAAIYQQLALGVYADAYRVEAGLPFVPTLGIKAIAA